MITKAEQAYDLYLNSFGGMAAACPQVLISQRNLFQLQQDCVMALVEGRRRAVEIEGMLLTGAIELASDSPNLHQCAVKHRPAGPVRTRRWQ